MVSGPSGSGKTSLVEAVLMEVSNLTFSVSHTTRKPRLREIHGKDYFFINEAKFKKMISDGCFLEHAQVYGHYYGTTKEFVISELASGHDVILDVDVQGAAQVSRYKLDSLLIFVVPPSLRELRSRLERRGLDNDSVIIQRLSIAHKEIQCYKHYHCVIINNKIRESVSELKLIIMADCYRVKRRNKQVEQIIQTFKEDF